LDQDSSEGTTVARIRSSGCAVRVFPDGRYSIEGVNVDATAADVSDLDRRGLLKWAHDETPAAPASGPPRQGAGLENTPGSRVVGWFKGLAGCAIYGLMIAALFSLFFLCALSDFIAWDAPAWTWLSRNVFWPIAVAMFYAAGLALLLAATGIIVQAVKLGLESRSYLAKTEPSMSGFELARWTTRVQLWPFVAGLSALSVVALLIAILPITVYEYYIALRWLVFSSAAGVVWVGLGGWDSYPQRDIGAGTIMMLVVAVMWNPVFPVELNKFLWVLLDYAAAVVFLFFCLPLDGTMHAISRMVREPTQSP
jgi:hypothetical protein